MTAPTDPGPSSPTDSAHPAHPAHRARRRVLVGIAILGVVLGAGIGVFAYLWSQSGARPVSLDEARRRFQAQTAGGAGGTAPFTPAEGVYLYRGTGSESLSTPPKSQDEGPEMPGTVVHGRGGCWTFRLDYSSNHWRKWTFCATPDELTETANRVFQRWDFVVSTIDNLADMTCTPPAVVMRSTMTPGDAWSSTCSGTNSQIAGTTVSTGTHVFVGKEPVTVGSATVEGFHFRDERVVSDAQTGTEEFDLWLSPEGLLLRGSQKIVVDSDSPIGPVTYTQQGAFALVRATPKA